MFKKFVSLFVLFCIVSVVFSADITVYTKERWLRPQGDKAKEIKIRMLIEPDQLTVQDKKNGSLLFEVPWNAIEGLSYSKSKHPRWKTGVGMAVAMGVFAIPFFFMKGKKHWLTIKYDEKMTAFRLDKKTFNMVIAEFEAKTGLIASRIED